MYQYIDARKVIPENLSEKLLNLGHEGHPSIVWMKRLRSKLWWPGMDTDVEKHCKAYLKC